VFPLGDLSIEDQRPAGAGVPPASPSAHVERADSVPRQRHAVKVFFPNNSDAAGWAAATHHVDHYDDLICLSTAADVG